MPKIHDRFNNPFGDVADMAGKLLTDTDLDVYSNIGTWDKSPITPRQNFLEFLSNWVTSIPLQSLWMVMFPIPLKVSDKMLKDYGEYVIKPGGSTTNDVWSVTRARGMSNSLEANKGSKMGCAFATSINIPGETAEINQIGFDNGGRLRDPIMSYRSPLQALSISFLETNLSFIDHLIRPWVVLASHRGFAARIESQGDPLGGRYGGMATDITVVQFGKVGTKIVHKDGNATPQTSITENKLGMQPRKVWVFKDCVPIKVDNQDMSYGIDNDLQKRATEWQYRRYQVYFPTPDIPTRNSQIDEAGKIGTGPNSNANSVRNKYAKLYGDSTPGTGKLKQNVAGSHKKEIEDAHNVGTFDSMKDTRGKFSVLDSFFTGKSVKKIKSEYQQFEDGDKFIRTEWQQSPGEGGGTPPGALKTAPNTGSRHRSNQGKFGINSAPTISANIFKGTTIMDLQKIYEDFPGVERKSSQGEDPHGVSKDYEKTAPFAKDGPSPDSIDLNYFDNESDLQDNAYTNWGDGDGSATAQKNLKSLQHPGHGPAPGTDAHIQEGTLSSMANQNDPKKIKQGSGIFGLLGL